MLEQLKTAFPSWWKAHDSNEFYNVTLKLSLARPTIGTLPNGLLQTLFKCSSSHAFTNKYPSKVVTVSMSRLQLVLKAGWTRGATSRIPFLTMCPTLRLMTI